MMSLCGSNRLTSFSAAGTVSTLEDAPLGLLDNLLDQGEPRAHRGKPGLDLDAGTRGGRSPWPRRARR